MIKKSLVLLMLLCLPLVSASLTIEKQTLVDSIVPEFNNSAIFLFHLTNNEQADQFRFYSTVGARFEPSDYFTIEGKESVDLQVKVYLTPPITDTTHIYNFQYKIDSKNSGTQEENMFIKVARLKDAITFNSYNINLDSENALVYVKNNVGMEFKDIKAEFKSAFFNFTKTLSLAPNEKKEFTIVLDRNEIKKLVAGDYIVTTDAVVDGLSQQFTASFKFTEKANIETKEEKSGILIRTIKTEKINQGNIPTVVQVKLSKNVISRLLTTFNVEPSMVERKGFTVNYLFQKEIQPSEIYTVKATTNWLYPLIVIILLVIIGYLVRIYTSSDLIIKKRTSFVKTKGGEFALKISLIVKAKKYVEKIKIVDKMPPMVKLFDKFGAIAPSRIDHNNRRIEWDIESLQQYEERVLSYVVFSKIGVVGRYELPKATAIFEKDGKLREASSNKVFFLTETPKSV